MKKEAFKILILCVLFLSISFQLFGQIKISGKIIDKDDKIGIPSVEIIEKGTKNGTTSDLAGLFFLEVKDNNSIIEIQFIGYKKKEIKVKESTFITIELKPECILDFFDSNDFCFGLSSGILNTPIGGFSYLTVPFYRISTLYGGIDYQIKPKENHKIIINGGLLHLIAECDYNGDLIFNYRQMKINEFEFKNYLVEGKLNFSKPRIFPEYTTLYVGYGLSTLSSKNLNFMNNSGVLMGFGTYVGRPLYVSVNLKAIYWIDSWEYIGNIDYQFKNLVISLNYNIIDNYSELNIKFGYKFDY